MARYRGAPGLVPAREVVGGTGSGGHVVSSRQQTVETGGPRAGGHQTTRNQTSSYPVVVGSPGTSNKYGYPKPPGTVTADSREDAKPNSSGRPASRTAEEPRQFRTMNSELRKFMPNDMRWRSGFGNDVKRDDVPLYEQFRVPSGVGGTKSGNW